MTGLFNLTYRNTKLFFKDKGMFFTSLITPLILLVLYAAFLAKVYRDSFIASLSGAIEVPERLIDVTVGGQLFSSLLAVSCVTVAFCSNMLSVQDKVSGARKDFSVSPVKGSVLSMSYFISTLIATLIICLLTASVSIIYNKGMYLTAGEIGLIVLDIIILSLFGTALSSIVNIFLTSQGQISAVGTVVSSGYGFICGAYMPISQFGLGLRRVISFLPGTYGTSLIRNHALAGAYREMKESGFPLEAIEGIKDSIDCNLYFFDKKVTVPAMYGVIIGALAVLMAVYIVLGVLRKNKR